ncbi:MAG: hypothetical protein GX755_09140 [Syntrophomonadaceae bacterium]|nr:hypothetical protein [Syntrophomonadaceae bacterium]
MVFEKVRYELIDSVAVVTLNDPKANNAFSFQLVSELSQAIDEAANNEAVRVVMITGGEKVFAAGGDIEGMLKMSVQEASHYSETVQKVFLKIESLGKPVIAVVGGPAIGGGCELTLICDLRIASTRAKFGQPEVDLGVMPGAGATKRLTRLVGPALAKEMIFTGKLIDAATAKEIGLVNQVVEPADLMNEAMKLARKIATKAPLAIRLAKETINRGMDTDIVSATEYETRGFALLFSTADRQEGMRAFLEKRRPDFQGK